MWEHPGDSSALDIWARTDNGKFDLTKVNPEYLKLVKSFVQAADDRGLYVGLMLFQGWSGACPGGINDWVNHPMYGANNIQGLHADPDSIGYGIKVHSLDIPEVVRYQENYINEMVNSLNGFNNLIWETGNETLGSSVPWKAHIIKYIKNLENGLPKQHLILDGTGNGVSNDDVYRSAPDIYSPCMVTRWANPMDPYIDNPPIPADTLGIPIVLDNDHLGNHFLRFNGLIQRNWAWKSFLRGNHPIHMDCYDIKWDGADPTMNHPIPGVNTNPHYDPQRKSLGDIQTFARQIDLIQTIPTIDSTICSTRFCMVNPGKEYLAYQPDTLGHINLDLSLGTYNVEYFDSKTSEKVLSTVVSKGGKKIFNRPADFKADWILLVKAIQ
tara:strand:- start:3099 stop:4247 length:1149 start_codon:yes stop_codon:yes gene_type:complete